VQSSFVVDEIPRSFEALLAETALVGFRHLVDVANVLLQRVEVRRLLAAVAADVLERFRAVVLHVAVVALEICGGWI
jgi:hypothetical protein